MSTKELIARMAERTQRISKQSRINRPEPAQQRRLHVVFTMGTKTSRCFRRVA